MGVMIPSDPWLTYRSAQLPLFRMIFPWVLAHMGVGSTSCLHSFLGTKYRPNRPNGDPIGGHFSFFSRRKSLETILCNQKLYVPFLLPKSGFFLFVFLLSFPLFREKKRHMKFLGT